MINIMIQLKELINPIISYNIFFKESIYKKLFKYKIIPKIKQYN